MNKPSNKTKLLIINRLYDSSGVCSFCGKPGCNHGSSQELPKKLDLDKVLQAINIDDYFFKDSYK